MNSMTFSQAATVLTDIVKQATGQEAIAAITTPQDFVAVAQTALKTGYDPVINAISQIWSRTIFSVRDYRTPMDSLMMDMPRYGIALRKLSPVSGEMVDDDRYKYPVAYDATKTGNPLGNGESVDMYAIKKQETLQTNFYGTAVYEQHYTMFRDQFDAAFESADEFSRYNAMCMTERMNDRESYKESIGRGIQANFIGGLLSEGNASRVIHLLSDYNAATGLSLTAQSVYQPSNFAPFMRWVYARIKTLSRMFAERSQMFQTVINAKPVLRHTNPENLRIALYAPAMDQMNAMVLSDTYNDNYLQYATYEAINFWQNIEDPDTVNIAPVYTDTTGALKQVEVAEPVEKAGIFGIIHDRDALGYAIVNDWAQPTPFNARGGYWNEFYHSTFKTVSDNTEKACVLLLD